MSTTVKITGQARINNSYYYLFKDVVLGSNGGGSSNPQLVSEAIPVAGGLLSFVVVNKSPFDTAPTAGGGFYVDKNHAGCLGAADAWYPELAYASLSDSGYSHTLPYYNNATFPFTLAVRGEWNGSYGFAAIMQGYQARWRWEPPSDGVGDSTVDILARVTPAA